ncbi:MAG: flagellar basal body rod C-terminal domain-containing protein [Sphingobium sp.]
MALEALLRVGRHPASMSITAIAITGLRASQMRLTASASNVANSAATGDATSVYRPQRVTQSAAADGGTTARMVADGGTTLRYQPGSPGADPRGMVTAPDIDLTQEAVDQMAAVQDFKANVKVIAAADAMTRSTLEIWG